MKGTFRDNKIVYYEPIYNYLSGGSWTTGFSRVASTGGTKEYPWVADFTPKEEQEYQFDLVGSTAHLVNPLGDTPAEILKSVASKCQESTWDKLIRVWKKQSKIDYPERPFSLEIPDTAVSLGFHMDYLLERDLSSIHWASKTKGHGKHKTQWWLFLEIK